MNSILVYSSDFCGYCSAAKSLLKQRGLEFREINVSRDHEKRAEMMERSGRRTVPQIFFGEQHIGGFTDLQAYFVNADKLNKNGRKEDSQRKESG